MFVIAFDITEEDKTEDVFEFLLHELGLISLLFSTYNEAEMYKDLILEVFPEVRCIIERVRARG